MKALYLTFALTACACVFELALIQKDVKYIADITPRDPKCIEFANRPRMADIKTFFAMGCDKWGDRHNLKEVELTPLP